MPGKNLTWEEAETRRHTVSVDEYSIDLDLTTGPETFRTRTVVRFTARSGASTFIDAITDTVHSIRLNGVELDPSCCDGLRIHLESLEVDNVLEVDADMRYTNTGEGLHRFVDPADGETYLYTQFEVADSRRVFPVFEQPDLKATFQFTVTAPPEWAVVSNSHTPDPVAGQDGNLVWTFAATPRLSSYVTAIIAGPYQHVHSTLTSTDGREIPLGLYARKSIFADVDAEALFDITRRGFRFYEERFRRPYPFDKYDQLFVPEFNAGAMENAGAVTIVETYVFRSRVTDAIRERRAVTVLHELAHMWFGDLVTMKWWNDLWLNESFAEWASTLATAEATLWREAWTTFQAMEKTWAYKQDQLPTTHPIVADIGDLEDVEVNFDGITYAKGASVLKQLVAWVGDDAFFAGVAAYFDRYAHANAELPDLLAELERTSGRDLGEWSTAWLETAGVNTLTSELRTASGSIADLAIVQSAPQQHPTLRPHRLAVGFYDRVGSTVSRRARFELDIDGERSVLPDAVGEAQPDLILINDDDLTYAKVRLDSKSHQFASENLSSVADPLARALIWGTFWDETRDGQMAARTYIGLVLDHIGAETESTTIRTTLNHLILTCQAYVAPSEREATRLRVADRLWQSAVNADAGSDLQFQLVTAFARLSLSPAQLNTVEELKEGRIRLDGLAIDTDLRWELITALTVGGRLGAEEIDREEQADNTSSGAQAAALARASLPTVDDKRRAWESVVHSDHLPNALVRATVAGFTRVSSPELLSSFQDDYFTVLENIWQSRSFKIAEMLCGGLYPLPLANSRLREMTATWLQTSSAPTALTRIVSEHLSEVDRALAAQKRDASGAEGGRR